MNKRAPRVSSRAQRGIPFNGALSACLHWIPRRAPRSMARNDTVHRSQGAEMIRNVLFALLVATAAIAQPHPMSFEDMLSLHRIGAPQLSPDGKWIAYDASTPDLKANRSTSGVFLVAAGGGASKQLTDGSGP